FSFEGGTGKTMLALNMGKMFVREKKKTLVVELDIFNPSYQYLLNRKVEKEKYLTDWLLKRNISDSSKHEFFDKCILEHETGIDFAIVEPVLTLNEINNRHTTLTADTFLDFLMGLIVEMKIKYDFIIIDCPSTLNIFSVFPEYVKIKPLDIIVNNFKNTSTPNEMKQKIMDILNLSFDNQIIILEHSTTYFNDVVTEKKLFLDPERDYVLYNCIFNYVRSYTREQKDPPIQL
ncbi:MAG: AAA family ATPase, partial [Candidatus Heimdallarchaeaceae archaeon]